MIRGKGIQAVLAVLSLVFLILAFKPGAGLFVREGMLTIAAAVWFLRVQIRRSSRFQPEVRQLGVILLLGVALCRLGNAQMPDFIWNGSSARAAVTVLLYWSIGLVAVPSCLCFYLCTPLKRVEMSLKTANLQRQKAAVVKEDYRMAV